MSSNVFIDGKHPSVADMYIEYIPPVTLLTTSPSSKAANKEITPKKNTMESQASDRFKKDIISGGLPTFFGLIV